MQPTAHAVGESREKMERARRGERKFAGGNWVGPSARTPRLRMIRRKQVSPSRNDKRRAWILLQTPQWQITPEINFGTDDGVRPFRTLGSDFGGLPFGLVGGQAEQRHSGFLNQLDLRSSWAGIGDEHTVDVPVVVRFDGIVV
jgi:hypothetical protein